MNRFRRLGTTAMVSLLAGWISLPAFAQDTYPKPVAESVEETAPGTLEFLSYPKYYINAEGKLVLVNTTIVPSLDPAYDYEVIEGIYRFKVKKDGTFMVEHEGDVFTYKFNSLGTGRGSGYKPFELGQADFSRFIVIGDTIRWSDVYKDIDLSVRYIHDILKVDVIVKNAFMADLKAEAKAGKLNKNDYLTARFDIPQVLITSKAKQNGKDKDLYSEALDVEQPVYFEKNGREIHKLRPVEAYLLDGKGEPVNTALDKRTRTAQVWNLKSNAAGAAEMSALISDLVELGDGDVVIDPSINFQESSSYTGCEDSFLYLNQTYSDRHTFNYGAATEMASWAYYNPGVIAWNETRPILRFNNLHTNNPNATVASAKLTLTLSSRIGSDPPGSFRIQPYAINESSENWVEGSGNGGVYTGAVSWSHRQYSSVAWQTAGAGTLDRWNGSAGSVVDVRTISTAGKKVSWDLTPSIIQLWLDESAAGDWVNGLLLECIDKFPNYTNSVSYYWHSSESATVTSRPRLTVTFKGPMLGGDVGNGYDNPLYLTADERIQDGSEDHLKMLRYFGADPLDQNKSFISSAHSRGLKVIICYAPHDGYDSGYPRTKDGYTDWIDYRLTQIEANTPGSLGNTIVAVQLGNEEGDDWGYSAETADTYYAGQSYAAYYVAARDRIKDKWPFLEVMAGSIENSVSLGYTTGGVSSSSHIPASYRKSDNGIATCAFLNGFIQQVKYLSSDSNDRLPDSISVHGYPARYPPEMIHDLSGGTKEWVERATQLDQICSFYGYSPRYAITEYGFSPNTLKDHCPTDGNQKTQAVYFMRRVLMDVCLRSSSTNKPWDYTTYWQQTRNPDGAQGDTGWYGDWDQTEANRYIIRDVARTILQMSSSSPSLSEGTRDWTSVALSVERNTQYVDEEETLRCGWINKFGKKWGAIWRYENSLNATHNPVTYYVPSGNESRTFTVSGENPGTAYLYKFYFGSPLSPSNTIWISLGTASKQQDGNNWVYTLPATYNHLIYGNLRVVDENPVFIQFVP